MNLINYTISFAKISKPIKDDPKQKYTVVYQEDRSGKAKKKIISAKTPTEATTKLISHKQSINLGKFGNFQKPIRVRVFKSPEEDYSAEKYMQFLNR